MVRFISESTPATSTPVAPPPTMTTLSNSCCSTFSAQVMERSRFDSMAFCSPMASATVFIGIDSRSTLALP